MRMYLMTLLLLLGGCKQILGIDQFELPDGGSDTPDGTPDDGATPDGTGGPSLTGKVVNITGSTFNVTNDPGEQVVWADLANGDTLDQTTTDANGGFTISLVNGNMGQLKVGQDLIYAVPGQVTTPVDVRAGIFDSTAFNTLLSNYSENNIVNAAHFQVIVEDENRQPVRGAHVAIDPPIGTLLYAGLNQFNYASDTETTANGIAWIFNVTAGTSYTITASKGPIGYGTYSIMPAQNALVYAPLLPGL